MISITPLGIQSLENYKKKWDWVMRRRDNQWQWVGRKMINQRWKSMKSHIMFLILFIRIRLNVIWKMEISSTFKIWTSSWLLMSIGNLRRKINRFLSIWMQMINTMTPMTLKPHLLTETVTVQSVKAIIKTSTTTITKKNTPLSALDG